LNCHAREVDGLEEPFALVVHQDTYILAVRRGLLEPEALDLLDRLIIRGTDRLAETERAAALTA
jgi:hypothetical protein